jgi:WD40 repeat protein
VTHVAFSPDGQQLASASRDSTVHLWDSQTGAALATLEGHSDTVTHVAFSPDGQQLASASTDSTVRLWHSHTYVHLASLTNVPTFGISFKAPLQFYAYLQPLSSPSGLYSVSFTKPFEKFSPTPICFFPPNWNIQSVSFNAMHTLAVVTLHNSQFHIIDISHFSVD